MYPPEMLTVEFAEEMIKDYAIMSLDDFISVYENYFDEKAMTANYVHGFVHGLESLVENIEAVEVDDSFVNTGAKWITPNEATITTDSVSSTEEYKDEALIGMFSDHSPRAQQYVKKEFFSGKYDNMTAKEFREIMEKEIILRKF